MATSKGKSRKQGAKKESIKKSGTPKKPAAPPSKKASALKPGPSKAADKPPLSETSARRRKTKVSKAVFGSGFEATAGKAKELRKREAEKNLLSKKRVILRPSNIPESQWALPAGFHPDGSFATLAEVVSDPIPTLSLESLSGQDKTKLILERIKLQEDFPTRYMLGVGEVSKERAIVEVEAGSPAGKAIQETEQKKIQLLQRAARHI